MALEGSYVYTRKSVQLHGIEGYLLDAVQPDVRSSSLSAAAMAPIKASCFKN
jgi:hypothetical protein